MCGCFRQVRAGPPPKHAVEETMIFLNSCELFFSGTCRFAQMLLDPNPFGGMGPSYGKSLVSHIRFGAFGWRSPGESITTRHGVTSNPGQVDNPQAFLGIGLEMSHDWILKGWAWVKAFVESHSLIVAFSCLEFRLMLEVDCQENLQQVLITTDHRWGKNTTWAKHTHTHTNLSCQQDAVAAAQLQERSRV